MRNLRETKSFEHLDFGFFLLNRKERKGFLVKSIRVEELSGDWPL